MKLSDEYYSLKLKYRKLFQESAQEIEAKLEQGLSVEQLEKSYISGITFSGGDPLFPENVPEVTAYIKELKCRFPEKTIWLYTGEVWEDIRELEVLRYIDVLIDGRFEQEKRDNLLHWCGSGNQRVINVGESLRHREIVIFNS